MILVDWQTYRKFWRDDAINGIGIYIDKNSGVTAAQLQAELRPKIAPYGDYLIKSNQELREQVFRIFDQTFSVTYILQTIGIIVSALGIFLSLTILVTERRREISILRAVGASRGQIEALVLWEAASSVCSARFSASSRDSPSPGFSASSSTSPSSAGRFRGRRHGGFSSACLWPSSPPRSSPGIGPRGRRRISISPTA